MLYDVHFYQNEAKRNPNWMKPFLRPVAPVSLAEKMSFRKLKVLKEFLKEQGKREFTPPQLMEYFIARGWKVTAAKQNTANFLCDLARGKRLVRAVKGNGRSKRYVAKAESGKRKKTGNRKPENK